MTALPTLHRRIRLPAAFWPLADQGIVSAGSFAVTLTLARSLAPRDFGIFTLLFLAILQAQLVIGSLLLYPLSVRGTVVSARERMDLFGNGLLLTLAVLLPLSIALAFGLTATGHTELIAPALAWLILGQVHELFRRGLFADMRHLAATPGDALRYLGQAALVLALAASGRLTIELAVSAMALSAAVASTIQALQCPVGFNQVRQLHRTARECWRIGHGSLASNLLSALSMQIFPWLLAAMGGPAAASAYQAAGNAVTVVSPVLTGLCNIIPQAAARELRRSGPIRAWRSSLRTMLLGAIPMLGYYAFTLAAPGLILATLYGSASPYVTLSTPTRLLALAAIISLGVDMTNAYLHGIEEARRSMKINFLGFAFACLCGLPMTLMWGLPGSCLAIVAANAVRTVAVALMFPTVSSQPRRQLC